MPIGRVGPDFAVNSTIEFRQVEPTITVLADGRFVTMWQSYDQGDGDETCIRGRLFNADGSPAGDDFIVDTTTAGIQAHPKITTLADSRFVATWTSLETGDGDGSCVRGRIYNADGTAAGNDFILNSTTTDDQYEPVITALPDGRFVVAWGSLDNHVSNDVRARVFNADGSPSGSDFTIDSAITANKSSPTIATLADGRFVVSWTEAANGVDIHLRARIYNTDGSPSGGDFIVNSTAMGYATDPAIAAMPDGRFVVTWQTDVDPGDTDSTGIRAEIFDPTVFVGTVVDDIWQGSPVFGDHINGADGNDILSGLGGNDIINGNARQ